MLPTENGHARTTFGALMIGALFRFQPIDGNANVFLKLNDRTARNVSSNKNEGISGTVPVYIEQCFAESFIRPIRDIRLMDWQRNPQPALWEDPTNAMLNGDPVFEAIWQAIRTWHVSVPERYEGYCRSTGSHVRAIYDAVVNIIGPDMWKALEIAAERVDENYTFTGTGNDGDFEVCGMCKERPVSLWGIDCHVCDECYSKLVPRSASEIEVTLQNLVDREILPKDFDMRAELDKLNELATEKPADPLASDAQALIDAAYQYWKQPIDGRTAAVRWLLCDDGALIVFTRGEYRDVILNNIEGMGPEHTFVEIIEKRRQNFESVLVSYLRERERDLRLGESEWERQESLGRMIDDMLDMVAKLPPKDSDGSAS